MSENKKMFSMHQPGEEKQTVDNAAIESKMKETSLRSIERTREALLRKQEIKPTTMEPLEDRLIIKADVNAEVKTEGGIYVPEEVLNRTQPSRGTIVAAGPGMPDKPMPLKAGDRVMYGHYAGTAVEDPETKENYLVMRLADVFIKL